jgi:hypothetical protein
MSWGMVVGGVVVTGGSVVWPGTVGCGAVVGGAVVTATGSLPACRMLSPEPQPVSSSATAASGSTT